MYVFHRGDFEILFFKYIINVILHVMWCVRMDVVYTLYVCST